MEMLTLQIPYLGLSEVEIGEHIQVYLSTTQKQAS